MSSSSKTNGCDAPDRNTLKSPPQLFIQLEMKIRNCIAGGTNVKLHRKRKLYKNKLIMPKNT